MKLKTLALGVAVLAVASLAAWFFNRGGDAPPADPRVGQKVFDPALIEKASSLHVHFDDKDLTLVKTSPTNWAVREYHDLPVDFNKFVTFVRELTEAKVTALATANPERMKAMEFEDNRLELRDADGKPLWTAAIGRSAENGGGRFLKLGGEEKAYRTTFSAWIDSTPKNWVDADVVPVKADQITSLEVSFPDSPPLVLTKETPAAPAAAPSDAAPAPAPVWKAEGLAAGETLKTSEVTSLVNRLADLRFTESTETTAPEAAAARENARNFKVGTAGGKTYTVMIGRQPAPPAEPKPADTAAADSAAAPAADASTPPAAEDAPAPQPGPVYIFVQSSESDDPINAIMERRAYQIPEWNFTSLPADRSALVQKTEPPPSPPATPLDPAASETAPPPPAEPATTP